MKITIDAVPPQGIDVSASLADAWAREAAAEALDAEPESLDVQLRVLAIDRQAQVRGHIATSFQAECGRCSAPVRVRLEGPVDLLYMRQAAPDAADKELSADDLDVSWYDGYHLDLRQVISEQLGLWMPARLRCEDETSERIEPGECEMPPQDPGPDLKRQNPFAALKRSE